MKNNEGCLRASPRRASVWHKTHDERTSRTGPKLFRSCFPFSTYTITILLLRYILYLTFSLPLARHSHAYIIISGRNDDGGGRTVVADKAPSEASFRGTEYLTVELNKGGPVLSTHEGIFLQFKTKQPNGLLFYSGKSSIILLYLYIRFLLCVSFFLRGNTTKYYGHLYAPAGGACFRNYTNYP